MTPKLNLLLVAFFAFCEVLAFIVVVPTMAIAIAAYGLLVCARAASRRARSLSSLTEPLPGETYDAASGSAPVRFG